MNTLSLPRSRALPALDCTLRTVLTDAVKTSGVSQREIARRTGLHHSTVGSVMSGRRSGTLDTWDLILAGAGVQLGFRIGHEQVAS